MTDIGYSDSSEIHSRQNFENGAFRKLTKTHPSALSGTGVDAKATSTSKEGLVVGLSFFMISNLVAPTIFLAFLWRERHQPGGLQQIILVAHVLDVYCTVTCHVVGNFGVTLASNIV